MRNLFCPLKERFKAFTLIELLIVVAIIAILAAIAVPNFLDAQVRAKFASVKSNMRNLDLVLTEYFMDTNAYPPENGSPNAEETLWRLTTPVPYISNILSAARDPFVDKSLARNKDVKTNYRISTFFYVDYMTFLYKTDGTVSRPDDLGTKTKFKAWGLQTHGPSRYDSGITWHVLFMKQGRANLGAALNTVYDPSNGTISWGNVARFGGDTPADASRLMN